MAVFGSVLIFVIGLIVSTNLQKGQLQQHSLRALRMALRTSFEYSENIRGQSPGGTGGSNGNASRNNASITFIEDRLSADSGKFGALNRTPLMIGSIGVHSRNLFMPIDADESYNIPRTDIYVNGVHFPFTVAGLKTVTFTYYDHDGDESLVPPPDPVTPRVTDPLYSIVANHPLIPDWDPACALVGTCFDLDRDGIEDVPDAEKATFAWQWKAVYPTDVDIEGGENVSVDVDNDLYEERILSINEDQDVDGNPLPPSSAVVMDFNEGDIDGSSYPPPGFESDSQMFTIIKPGTYLEIKEGKLYSADPTRQFISTASKKDSVDIIQRVFRLSNNTGRFCSTGGVLQGYLVEDGLPNPVEACNNCFDPANIEKTCMDTTNLLIFIRSRIQDLHGRKYVTNLEDDPYVSF